MKKYITDESCPYCGEIEQYEFTENFPVATCKNSDCGKNVVLCSACDMANCGGCVDGNRFKLHPLQEELN